MGFLSLPDSDKLDMAKVTISFWFRFPQEAMDSVLAHPPPRGGANGYSEDATWPVLQWQMTLLSWGDQVPGTVWWPTLEQTGSIDADSGGPHDPVPFLFPVPTLSQTGPMMPCSICLDFRLSDSGDYPQLVVNLQSDQMSSIQNVYFTTQYNVVWVGGEGFGYAHSTTTYEDQSWSRQAPLGISKTPITGGDAKPVTIRPDTWHHLLVSWDVTGSITCGSDSTAIESDFRMYYALDDKNHDKSDLPADWIGDVFGLEPGAAGSDPNTIISNDSIFNSLPWPASEGSTDIGADVAATPAGSFGGTMGPLKATKLFVPGSPNYTDGGRTVNSVYKVEMAELQIFAGVMLDTSSETNRRAFVDKEGEPVPPTQKKEEDADGNKTKDSGSIELLGKEPDILLHLTNNWKKGKNTGSIGVDDDGNDIPSGQFTPTGTIKKYTPDPSIAAPSG